MILAPTNRRIIRPGDKPSFEHTQRYGLIKGHPLGPAGGLVGFWLFNEGSGGQVFDLSGGNIGTLGAEAPWTPGPEGPCIDFAGNGRIQAIQLANTITFLSTDKWTLTFKAQGDGDTEEVIFIGEYNTSDDRIALWEGNSFHYVNSSGTAYTFAGVTTFTNWAIYSLVADGTGNLSLYIDGVLNEKKTEIVSSYVFNAIGSAYNGDTYAFDGRCSFVYLHRTNFSASKIALLYREPFCMVEKKAAPVYFFVPVGGVVYQELLLDVSAAASAAKTDVHQMIDTNKAVQADAGIAKIDTHQMLDTNKAVSAVGTVSCTDLKVVFELDLAISADASVSESDTQQMMDTGKEVSADASVLAADVQTMIETGKSVTAIASPAVIDTQAMVEVGSVSAEGSVSCMDTMGLLAHIAAFMILRQCTT